MFLNLKAIGECNTKYLDIKSSWEDKAHHLDGSDMPLPSPKEKTQGSVWYFNNVHAYQ